MANGRVVPDRARIKPARDPSHDVDKPVDLTKWICFDDAERVIHYGQTADIQVTTTSLRNMHEYDHALSRTRWRNALVNDFGIIITQDEADYYGVDPSAAVGP